MNHTLDSFGGEKTCFVAFVEYIRAFCFGLLPRVYVLMCAYIYVTKFQYKSTHFTIHIYTYASIISFQ